jgi:hypothetical protein
MSYSPKTAATDCDPRAVAINACLNNFRFDRVHRTMETLNWVWASCNMRVPNVRQIMDLAEDLLSKAWDGKYTTFTGGLEARYIAPEVIDGVEYGPDLELRFVVEWSQSGEY